MPQRNSESILTEAAEVFVAGRADYRQAMLRVGGLLHQYVVARVRLGDGKTAVKRRKAGLCRHKAVEEAARKLNVTRRKVAELIHTNRMVELLGASDVPPSWPSWHTLRLFNVFVKRPAVGRGEGGQSRREEWEVAGDAGPVRELFWRACEGRWRFDRVREAIRGIQAAPVRVAPESVARPLPRTAPADGYHDDSQRCPTNSPRLAAMLATPRDLADMVMDMISANPQPRAVVEALVGHRLWEAMRKGKVVA